MVSEKHELTQDNKPHRTHRVGGKIKKKNRKVSNKGKNDKAFTFRSAIKAGRAIRRAADKVEKKKHIPVVDRIPVEPPPYIVAIVGPPKVGKSTLLRCLVKHHVRQSVSEIRGPITIVTGKKRRITFIEVDNDINSLLDVAKIADMVLLLVDASYGFEMETFEFLNICQVHGMPRILGVLTHLDVIKTKEKVKQTKKILKHRFWTEVYQGAKLFYLSGMINENYLKNEIRNLARFISVAKFRPLVWRTTHPYVLCDRFEDLTDPELIRTHPMTNRYIALYGWIRGTFLKNHSAVHIPGVGDLRIKEVFTLPDPCPLPSKENSRRTLNNMERIIYAPFSGLGGIVYDKDAIYIETGGSHIFKKARHELIEALDNVKESIDEKINKMSFKLLSGSAVPVTNSEELSVTRNLQDNEMDEDEMHSGEVDGEFLIDSDTEVTDGEDNNFDLFNLSKKSRAQYNIKEDSHYSWSKIVYSDAKVSNANSLIECEEHDRKFVGGLFKIANVGSGKIVIDHQEDGFLYKFPSANASLASVFMGNRDWTDEDTRASISDEFVTGKWNDDEDAETVLEKEFKNERVHGSLESDSDEKSDNEIEEYDNEDSDDSKDSTKNCSNIVVDSERYKNSKERLKAKFNAEYDETNRYYIDLKDELEKQSKLNKSAFDEVDETVREQLEGFRPGSYARFEFEDVPIEFVKNFDSLKPYIIGGLLASEQNIGSVQVRIKKHRWYNRILKSRDPLIISCGWRRFQTVVLYSMQDHNMRQRFLKYTPEHMYCHAVFWGPIVAQNTGLIAIQSLTEEKKGYRIAATGVVLNLDKTFELVKKLKLIGYPYEIMKKSAFIKDMFNSPLEVAKFEGASIRTVSGVRGIIKKAERDPSGAFRATFEDKILLSDIVFLRSWVTVPVPRFYTPVTNHLLPSGEIWEGMRTVGRLRFEMGLHPPVKTDSLYHEVERRPFEPAPLVIPKNLQKKLPYRLKPKTQSVIKKNGDELVKKHTAVILEPHESKVHRLMDMLSTVDVDRQKKELAAQNERVNKHRIEKAALEERRLKGIKISKKKICRSLSKREQFRLKKAIDSASNGNL